jgi:hypothetical protein
MPLSLPQRVPENAPGDFYVEAGCCTSCCLPHGEAPELLNDPDEPFKECYFRRQPRTPEEVDRAVEAICVSEVCALRYGGTDPAIIDKLRRRDAAAQCDHTPEGRAWIEAPARRAAAAPPVAARPLSYFRPVEGDEPPPQPLLTGVRRARAIAGWIALAAFVFAGLHAGDRDRLQWPATFAFMACLAAYVLTALIVWAVRIYVTVAARRRRR